MPRGRKKKELIEGLGSEPNPPSSGTGVALPKTISVEIAELKPEAPVVQSIKDDRDYIKVLITYRGAKGHEKTTSYVMSPVNLSIHEDIDEKFTEGGRKQTRIHLALDGDVLEKI